MRQRRALLHLFLLVMLAATLSLIGCRDDQAPATFSAKTILDQTAVAYATCTSYYDSGRLTVGDERRTVEVPFSTAFVRPNRFRFECTMPAPHDRRQIVWCDGEDIRNWSNFTPALSKYESLEMAVAAATGVTGGLAHTIPALLLPDQIGGRKLTDMTEVTRLDDAKLDKLWCFRIEGRFGDISTTIWIDQKVFIVRRIDRPGSTTIFDPVVNSEVSEEMLRFDPPERSDA